MIWHTETPTVRTAPAPMFLLSQLVHDHNFKVVMTGEGADELLGGYDIFKEMVIRRFWAKDPDSTIRPLLLKRLYPEIGQLNSASGAFLMAFFKRGLTPTDDTFYSHAIRWNNAARLQRFMLDPDVASKHLEEELVPIPRWIRDVVTLRPGAVSGNGYIPGAVSAFLTRRSGGDGPFCRRTLSLPGLPHGGVLRPAASQIQDAGHA